MPVVQRTQNGVEVKLVEAELESLKIEKGENLTMLGAEQQVRLEAIEEGAFGFGGWLSGLIANITFGPLRATNGHLHSHPLSK